MKGSFFFLPVKDCAAGKRFNERKWNRGEMSAFVLKIVKMFCTDEGA